MKTRELIVPADESATASAKQKREFAGLWLALRMSPRFRMILAATVSFFIGALAVFYQTNQISTQLNGKIQQQAAQITTLNGRVETFASSCASNNSCETFPFREAEQIAVRYSVECFNYSSTSPVADQTNRLKRIPGGDTCGWQNDGSAATVAVVEDSAMRLNIPLANGKGLDPKLGLVGVDVKLVGQPDFLSYVVPVRYGSSGLSIAYAGGLYTARPTLVVPTCQSDNTFNTTDIKQRLQSMEAGRVNTPNIDPQDYVVSGMTIGRFGPSVTGVTVENVVVCQGSGNVRYAVAKELLSGPTPGSHFEFTYGYKLQKSDKWYVSGWGPVLSAVSGL